MWKSDKKGELTVDTTEPLFYAENIGLRRRNIQKVGSAKHSDKYS